MKESTRILEWVQKYAPGWRTEIRLHRQPEADAHALKIVSISRPGSAGAQLALEVDEAVSEEKKIRDWLTTNPEVETMRFAPQPLIHPRVCRQIRTAAEAHGWDRETVAEVTTILVDVGAPTDLEPQWLQEEAPSSGSSATDGGAPS